MRNIRIGHGFDVHQLKTGQGIILAGLTIPCEYGIVAHSDGDLILHAVSDAMLGALAKGDIGEYFPDTDEKWKNADSRIIIEAILKMLEEEQWSISNVDVTLVAQAPRISEYKSDLCATLANILQINRNQVNIKATTTEKMGYLGRKEGIAAHAVVCLYQLEPE